jgi:hypothetical protein
MQKVIYTTIASVAVYIAYKAYLEHRSKKEMMCTQRNPFSENAKIEDPPKTCVKPKPKPAPAPASSIIPTSVDRLKNALLSFALMNAGNVDSMPSYNFDTYDGTTLPAFAGYDLPNACFSYLDIESVGGVNLLEEKQDVIHKYLQKQLDTDEKVEEFFRSFLSKLQSTHTESHDIKKDIDMAPSSHPLREKNKGGHSKEKKTHKAEKKVEEKTVEVDGEKVGEEREGEDLVQ